MADRFANSDPANDTGGYDIPPGTPAGDERLITGFDPTAKGFYHGGDINGITEKLDYLKDLGITSVWMTPSFKNKPVQGERRRPQRRLPRLLDHRLHPDRPAPGHQRGPDRADRRRPRSAG